MSVLVDTNVISELARREPNLGVIAWSKTIANIALSVISVEEICYGLALKSNERIKSGLKIS
jgi:predicted nucleic acid-binding protein